MRSALDRALSRTDDDAGVYVLDDSGEDAASILSDLLKGSEK